MAVWILWGLIEGDGRAPLLPATHQLFPHKLENPRVSQELPSLLWLNQMDKSKSNTGARWRDPTHRLCFLRKSG